MSNNYRNCKIAKRALQYPEATLGVLEAVMFDVSTCPPGELTIMPREGGPIAINGKGKTGTPFVRGDFLALYPLFVALYEYDPEDNAEDREKSWERLETVSAEIQARYT